jgi:outer membrane protein TolC
MIKPFIKPVLIFVWLGMTANLLAQETLSLSKALETALSNNYGIIISRADLEIAEINNNWGNAGRYPTIGFNASDNLSHELLDQSTSNRLSAGVGLNWVLFDGFRVDISKTRLENLEDLTSGRLAVNVENTVEDIMLAYYFVLLQQEQLKVLKTVMDLSDDRYQYELRHKELGGSVTYNVLQAQNVYLTDKANFMSQEVAIRNSVRNLNFMMGLEPERTWVFDELFEADTTRYVLADLLAKMRSDNQTLKNQYTNLMLQQNETALRQADYYPSISLGTGIDYSHNWSKSPENSAITSQGLSPYGSVRLSFDIYSAGVRRRAVEIARINEEVAQVEIDQMEHALTNQLLNLYDYYEVRIALLNVANENMAAAELNMSISEEKYRTGVINSFNYRDVQLLYLNAAFRRLQAVYNLIDYRTQLTRITGGFLGSVNP